MDILEPRNIVTLSTECRRRYEGIAFDGCFFYLTMPQECMIYRFNRDFTPAGSLGVERPYKAICYDSTENCFWASSDKSASTIYRLDCDLKETDRLQIRGCATDCMQITGLSYNCEQNTLLVAFKTYIAEIAKDGCCVRVLQSSSSCHYAAVLAIAPYYAVIRQCGQTQELVLFSAEGEPISSFCMGNVYALEDILFYPCRSKDRSVLQLILLATKNRCYPRILYCEIPACDICLCCCNYEICCARCEEDHRKEQCICDLIESIALVETALSHILNAEGEKLQKAIEIADNICDLLEVNRSVNRTITNVTQLEHLLYAKLDTLSELCAEPCFCNGPDLEEEPD